VPDQRAFTLAFTTNPGLEDLAFDELRERLGADGEAVLRLPSPVRGRLQVTLGVSPGRALRAAWRMRSVHHVLRPLAELSLPVEEPLARLERILAEVPVPELGPAVPFRVTAKRHGTHGFGSPDVERRAGAALRRRFGARVDLEGYAVEVLITIVGATCLVALRLSRRGLSRRFRRVYHYPAALRANVAYAALRLAGAGPSTRRVLDPFCGSGTLLLEAGALAPGAELWGSDWRSRAVTGTGANLEAAGLAPRATLRQADARRLAESWPECSVDLLAGNPPFGRRLGSGMDFRDFYGRVLEQIDRILAPAGRAVLLADHRVALEQATARQGSFRVTRTRVVDVGGIFPGIVLLERVRPAGAAASPGSDTGGSSG